MKRALVGATIGCLAVALAYLGYGVLAPLQDQPPLTGGHGFSRRPSAKSTCPEAIVTRPPSGMAVSDRQLVPFSSTQLGVNTVISDPTGTGEPPSGSRMIEVDSGGYVSELAESYDDLRPIETISVTGQPESLLAGGLLTATVKLVIWRQPGVAPPCDVHAVLAMNLSKEQFKAVVKSVRVDHSPASARGSADNRR